MRARYTATSNGAVVISGGAGLGKTTLVKLLVGLYTPQQGEILYDNIPITQVDLDRLRERRGHEHRPDRQPGKRVPANPVALVIPQRWKQVAHRALPGEGNVPSSRSGDKYAESDEDSKALRVPMMTGLVHRRGVACWGDAIQLQADNPTQS